MLPDICFETAPATATADEAWYDMLLDCGITMHYWTTGSAITTKEGQYALC